MQAQLHSMTNLFAQLGLPSDEAGVETFIAAHRPLKNDVALYRAPFWSDAQRASSRKNMPLDKFVWHQFCVRLNSPYAFCDGDLPTKEESN